MIHQLIDLWLRGWRSLVEILLLWVAIYYGYLYFRGTRGAKVQFFHSRARDEKLSMIWQKR